jgi:beta-glucosidase
MLAVALVVCTTLAGAPWIPAFQGRRLLPAAAVHLSEDPKDPHARAVRLVGQMTLAEKMGFIQGNQSLDSEPHGSYVGVVPGVPRLGIPDLRMNDGPEGFRGESGTSTQWPSGLTVAHSW